MNARSPRPLGYPAPNMADRPTTYRFPVIWMLGWIATAIWPARRAGGWTRLGHRDPGADGERLLARRPTRTEGFEQLPREGGVVLVLNHYERPGMRVWWPALLVSAAVRSRRGPDAPAVRWLVSVEFHRYHLGPLRIPDSLMAWVLRLIARRYAAIPVPRDPADVAGRSRALREARRAVVAGHPVGITPEAAATAGDRRVLAVPDPNTGVAVALLARGGIPIVPVAVFEDSAVTLVARAGLPYALAPTHGAALAGAAALRDRVMRSLAELLPEPLRGPYAATPLAPPSSP